MSGINFISFIFYTFVGFLLGFGLTSFAQLNLEAEQEAYFEEKGEYISDPKNGVHTYTTLCKGYFYDDGLGTVTGYGDLADKYTYQYEKGSSVSTTTDPKSDILR